MAFIHQLNELVKQFKDTDFGTIANVVAVRELIDRTEAHIGHKNAVLFVSAMTIELSGDLHTKYPEEFSELMDNYAHIIRSLYGVALTYSQNREVVDAAFLNMAKQASINCDD